MMNMNSISTSFAIEKTARHLEPLTYNNSPVTNSISVAPQLHSATISWKSNEPVQGRVMFATSWPLPVETTASVATDLEPRESQMVVLSGLLARTIYHYMIESIDMRGNMTLTIGKSFMTS